MGLHQPVPGRSRQWLRAKQPRSTATRSSLTALYAPEADEPHGAAAKDMAALVVYGEHVVCTVVDRDRPGGLVADCVMSSDGADFAEVMIRAGYADHCPACGRPDLAFLPKSAFDQPAYCK